MKCIIQTNETQFTCSVHQKVRASLHQLLHECKIQCSSTYFKGSSLSFSKSTSAQTIKKTHDNNKQKYF